MATLASRFRRQVEMCLRNEEENPAGLVLKDVGTNTLTLADDDDEEISFVIKIEDHNGHFSVSSTHIILEGAWLKKLNDFCTQGKKAIQDVVSLASKEYFNILASADDDGEVDAGDAEDDGEEMVDDVDDESMGEDQNAEEDYDDDDDEEIVIDEDELEKKELPIHQIIKTEVETWLKSFKWRRSQEQRSIVKEQKILEKQTHVPPSNRTKPQLDMELIDIDPNTRTVSLALNKAIFSIRYPTDYNPAKGQNLFVSTESPDMTEIVKRLNHYLSKKSSSLYAPNVAIAVLLTKALEVFIEYKYIEPMTPASKKSVKDDIFGISTAEEFDDDDESARTPDADQDEFNYKRAWGAAEAITGPYSHEAKHALLRQLQNCMKRSGTDGWELELFDQNPFVWRVRLYDFPENSLLAQDLEIYDAKFNLGRDIIIELKFTGAYPNEPPAVRIVRPRLTYLSGNISFGGAFCVDFLNASNWNKYTFLDVLITQLKKSLVDNGARIDLRTHIEYDEKVATDSFVRLQRMNTMQFPTVNQYSDKLFAFTASLASSMHGVHVNSHALEKGNKVLLPLSAADRIFQQEFKLPLIFELKSKRGIRVYTGVSEFTAPENNIVMPNWLLKSLYATEGQKIDVRCVDLPQGTYIKLQPHSKEFYEIDDHKTVLENTLMHYSCVTEGQSIPVYYNNKEYLVELIELKPERAVSLIADRGYLEVEIDFVPALDLIDAQTLKEDQDKLQKKRQAILKMKIDKSIKRAQKHRMEKLRRVEKAIQDAKQAAPKDVANVRYKFPNGQSAEINLLPSTPTQILYEYVETLENPTLWIPKPYSTGLDLSLTTQYPTMLVPNSFAETVQSCGLYPKGMLLVSEHDRFPNATI